MTVSPRPLSADPFPRQKPRHDQLSCAHRPVRRSPHGVGRWDDGRRSHAANVPDPSPRMQWGAVPGVGCVRCIPYSRRLVYLFRHATVAARLASASECVAAQTD
jgi:hypothetical protein